MRGIKFLVAVLALGLFVSCSKDNGGTVENASALILGEWYCTFQQWTEDGTWSETYEPSSTYMMYFSTDGTGYMKSGSDELFEIGGSHDFTWLIYKENKDNWLYIDVYGGERYRIDKLTSNELVMTWTDEDYSITCKFQRQ